MAGLKGEFKLDNNVSDKVQEGRKSREKEEKGKGETKEQKVQERKGQTEKE